MYKKFSSLFLVAAFFSGISSLILLSTNALATKEKPQASSFTSSQDGVTGRKSENSNGFKTDAGATTKAGDALDALEKGVETLSTLTVGLFTIALFYTTYKQLLHLRREFAVAHRPFVWLDELDPFVTSEPGTRPPVLRYLSITPRWRNSGNGPTKDLRVSIDWDVFDASTPPDPYPLRQPESVLFIGPRASEQSATLEIDTERVNDVIAHSGTNPGERIFLIWGRAEYKSMMNDEKTHFCQWCYRGEFRPATQGGGVEVVFSQWGNHNATDEDSSM